MKIETLAKFVDTIEKESLLQKEKWVRFVFDADHVVSFNEYENGYTTIELTTGLRQIVAIQFDDYLNFVSDIEKMINYKAVYEFLEY